MALAFIQVREPVNLGQANESKVSDSPPSKAIRHPSGGREFVTSCEVVAVHHAAQ